MAIRSVIENIPQVPAATREKIWNLPLVERWRPFPIHWLHIYPVFHRIQFKWLDFLEETRDSLRHPHQGYMNIHFSTAAQRKFHARNIISRRELIACLWLKTWASFPQAPQVEFPSAISRWEGLCAFCLKWNVPWEAWLKRRPNFRAVA